MAIDCSHGRARSVGRFLSILSRDFFIAFIAGRFGEWWKKWTSSGAAQTNVAPIDCSRDRARSVGDILFIPARMINFDILLLAFIAGRLGDCPRRK